MDDLKDKFYYVHSASLEARVRIKIGTLEGKSKKLEYDKLLNEPRLGSSGLYEDGCADLMVECQVFSEGLPLALPVTTIYRSFTQRWSWNEWVTLPVMYCDLPRDALLALTIYDTAGPSRLIPVGGTTVKLFGKHGVFRQGMIDLKVWPDQVADGRNPSSTPGKTRNNGKEQMPKLSKMAKSHRNGHVPTLDWLDRLSFREMELINEKEKRESQFMYLMVEFPDIVSDGENYAVVYYEQDSDEVYQFRAQADIVTVPDYEILQENLVENKHHKLSRSLRSGMSDKDAKPSTEQRNVLNAIVDYLPTRNLTTEEQDLVWRFRYYLSADKKALPKFLACVNWNLSGEAKQALAMLEVWAPTDVGDALQLLSPQFTHPAVRGYAVSRLRESSDEDLLLFLLQLVQALKYENFAEVYSACCRVLDSRLTGNSTFYHGSMQGSLQSSGQGLPNSSSQTFTQSSAPSSVHSFSQDSAQEDRESTKCDMGGNGDSSTQCDDPNDIVIDSDSHSNVSSLQVSSQESLAAFLIHRASQNFMLANYFYWYLHTECEDPEGGVKQDNKVQSMYKTVKRAFLKVLEKGNPEFQRMRQYLGRQEVFIDSLLKLVKLVARESGNRKKKIERLQALLADPEAFKINFSSFDPLPFPLDPDICIKGIVPEKATIFKSALTPTRLTFLTTQGIEYNAIFKHGDDLRQDQLILQIITLMDKLLRKENLDLKLTPYRVLATSTKHGKLPKKLKKKNVDMRFLQFIDSFTVAEVLSTEGSIQNFFRRHHPSDSGPYGIARETMDTYIRSCAGYCVITYILGVGDRHLDNLLLTTDGKLFHIDFGYILGRDPKPLPPPVKLSKEMVDAMGGSIQTEHYAEFRKQCFSAFLILRRNANLVLNLFSLMVDASVPDIALEPDKTVKKVQDKLLLHLADEEALHSLQSVLDMSATAVIAAVMDQVHRFAQYWRK